MLWPLITLCGERKSQGVKKKELGEKEGKKNLIWYSNSSQQLMTSKQCSATRLQKAISSFTLYVIDKNSSKCNYQIAIGTQRPK